MRSTHPLATLAGLGLAVVAGTSALPPAFAASPSPSQEACSGDNSQACLVEHGHAAAQMLSTTFSATYGKLDGACSEVISPGISACLEQAQTVADQALNDAYQRAAKSIPNDDNGRKWRERLKLAQEAWLRFRDADCGDLVTSEMGTGSGLGAALIACRLGKTESRTTELLQRYGS